MTKINPHYITDIENITEDQLNGFFVGWPNPPSNKIFLKLLKNSYRVVLALSEGKVVGFITSVSDGLLSAYIPFLEVLPEYQSRGIGRELISRMKKELKHLYMIDLLCDEKLVSYYETLGMRRAMGAMIRNYENQSGNKGFSQNK